MQSGDVPLTVPDVIFETVKTLTALSGLLHPLLTVYVIFVVPALNAVTNPVDEFTVATVVLVLLQLPPVVPLLVYVAVLLIQRGEVPLTVPAVTLGLTVNVLNALTGLPQPAVTVYVIFVVPAVTADTNPVDELTVATPVLVLLQLPPGVPLLVYVAVALMQSGEVPLTVPAVHPVIVKLVLDISKNIFPTASILIRQVEDEAAGTVIVSVPSLSVLAAITVGKVMPPSVDSVILTLAQLTGAAVVLFTFQVIV